jgi:hypothetical protein
MIIKIFKISTKEMYTFKNKIELFNFVQEVAHTQALYNRTITQIIEYLPAEDYCRVT